MPDIRMLLRLLQAHQHAAELGTRPDCMVHTITFAEAFVLAGVLCNAA